METKRCSKCGETRPSSDFYKRKAATDGLNPWCIECYRRWHLDRYKPKITPPAVMVCEWCGSKYESKQRRSSKYCGPNCKQRATWWRTHPKEPKACAECGTDITDRRRSAIYCSNACAQRARAVRTGPEARRKWRMTNKYGITPDDYDRMLSEQNQACAICKATDPGTVHGFWHVDHCHDRGHVRGLLCNTCNLALGLMADDPARLRAAADYIERASPS